MMGLGSQMQLQLGPAYHGLWCICSTFTLLQPFPLCTLTSTLLLTVLCLNGTCTSSIHYYLVVWCLILNPIQAISPFSSLCSRFRNYHRETNLSLTYPWVSRRGLFHCDFCRMNSELSAMTPRSGELNTGPV